MNLVDHLRFGPFRTTYHRSSVNDCFIASLNQFLDRALLTQLDTISDDAEGSLVAVFDRESNCGPNSLVRDIYKLDVVLYSDEGNSELKADIVFDPASQSFAPRNGHNQYFYLWTPTRKREREQELTEIQRFADDVRRHRPHAARCPVCEGEISIVNNSMTFDVRCKNQHCFVYSYHKDENGNLLHGHFMTKHPAGRT